jgi:hypothetical protein
MLTRNASARYAFPRGFVRWIAQFSPACRAHLDFGPRIASSHVAADAAIKD